MAAQVVVITGASGGIGRATARLFAKRGAKVALLARGTVGLEAAAKDVEAAGGTALVIPTDVADYEQVEHAAARAEEVLGPIDVWINDAFTSVRRIAHGKSTWLSVPTCTAAGGLVGSTSRMAATAARTMVCIVTSNGIVPAWGTMTGSESPTTESPCQVPIM